MVPEPPQVLPVLDLVPVIKVPCRIGLRWRLFLVHQRDWGPNRPMVLLPGLVLPGLMSIEVRLQHGGVETMPLLVVSATLLPRLRAARASLLNLSNIRSSFQEGTVVPRLPVRISSCHAQGLSHFLRAQDSLLISSATAAPRTFVFCTHFLRTILH